MTTEGGSVSHLTWCTSSATPMDISLRLILYWSLNKYSFDPLTNTLQAFLKIQHKCFDRYCRDTEWNFVIFFANTAIYQLEKNTPGPKGQWTSLSDNNREYLKCVLFILLVVWRPMYSDLVTCIGKEWKFFIPKTGKQEWNYSVEKYPILEE